MELYTDELDQWGRSGAFHCIYTASDILSKVIRSHAMSQFGIDHNDDGEPDGVLVDRTYYPMDNLRVMVTHMKPERNVVGTFNRRANSHVFYVPANDKVSYAGVKVHVDQDDLLREFKSALEGTMNDVLGLESEPLSYWVTLVVRLFMETFAHEVDHLWYYLKRTGGERHDLTYISGAKRDKKDGKRFGKRGYAHDGTIDDQYFGSPIEMQAWASGAAAELIDIYVRAGEHTWSVYNDTDWNGRIDRVIDMVRSGNAGLNLYQVKSVIHAKVSDDRQYRKVWTSFLRLLIDKLNAYRRSSKPRTEARVNRMR